MLPHHLLPTLLFLALPTTTLARIAGISAPPTVTPGTTFALTIETEDYIQAVSDVAMAFGYAPQSTFYNGTLGTLLSDRFIGPDESNVLYNLTHYVTLPVDPSLKKGGKIVFAGSALSLYGVGLTPTLEYYTATSKVA